MNTTAKSTVATNPYKVPLLFPWIKEWCAQVTVIPDDKSNTVLSKGNSKGFIASIPIGGHWAPNSTVGDKALVFRLTICYFAYKVASKAHGRFFFNFILYYVYILVSIIYFGSFLLLSSLFLLAPL